MQTFNVMNHFLGSERFRSRSRRTALAALEHNFTMPVILNLYENQNVIHKLNIQINAGNANDADNNNNNRLHQNRICSSLSDHSNCYQLPSSLHNKFIPIYIYISRYRFVNHQHPGSDRLWMVFVFEINQSKSLSI